MLIHLDTDFGGDPDDACALAFLLASPLADLIAVTTNLDAGGYELQRVSYALAHLGVIDACALAAWYEHEGYEGYSPPNSCIVGAELGLDWLERDIRDERSRTA